MESAPASHQKAGRGRLLWLAGVRGVAQAAAPGCQGCGGCGRAPAGAPPCHLSARHLALPILGRSASHQTPVARCLCFGSMIACPAPSASAGTKEGWRRLAKGNLSFAEQKAPHKLAQQLSRFHSPGFCKAVQGWCLNTAVYGKDEKRELRPLCWNQGSLSSSCPQSASSHGRRGAQPDAGCHMGTLPSREAQDCGDGGCSNSCRK